MTFPMGFSIIVPTYNRAELLGGALDSIARLRIPSGWDAELLVINNNSTDGTETVAREAARKGPIPLRHLVEGAQGASHARNRAIIEARYEHLVYLDDDMTEVAPDWLEAYRVALDQFQPDCVVGPVEPSYEVPLEPWMTPEILSCTAEYSRKGDKTMLLDPERAHEIPGCNFAVRRSVAVEIGGFNTALGPTAGARTQIRGEDFEFGERLVLLGKRVAYVPACKIRHFVSCQKASARGLRARWEGDGATERRLMSVRGERLTPAQRLRLTARMVRFFGNSIACRLRGDARKELTWDLRARKLRGFLLERTNGVSARTIGA